MRLVQYIRLDKRDPEGKAQRDVIAKFKPEGEFSTEEHVELLKRAVGDYPKIKTAVKSLRASDDLIVVADFWRLATRIGDLADNVELIRSKNGRSGKKLGCVIVEARTGRRSDCQKDLARMMAESANTYAGRGLSPLQASINGKLGAIASPVAKPKEGRAPWKVIVAALKSEGKVADAIAVVNALGHETPINRLWLHREALRRKTTIKALRAKRTRLIRHAEV